MSAAAYERSNLKCPKCGQRQSYVLDNRPVGDGSVTRRRRECPHCRYRFTTYERLVEEPDEPAQPPPPPPPPPPVVVRAVVHPRVPPASPVTDLEDGYYWWRKDVTVSWELAHVLHRDGLFIARFFNGMHITQHPWGDWVRVEIEKPA